MSMPDQVDSPNLEDLTPEEANRIIHSHRKVRYGTACWPCRQRKVKCDNKSPCENCVKRDHPQLCSYKPNNRSQTASVKHGSPPSEVSHGRKREHSPDDTNSRSQSLGPRPQPNIRTYDPDADTTRYLGQNSIPALLREQTSPNDPPEGVDHIRQDMRSILGLDNTAPFPLMSSRHLDRMTIDIATELPSDREVMKLFRTYKEIPQQFWGLVIDINDLETRLMVYLEERAKNSRAQTKATKPVSASWLSILFAVLAVGSQYHDSPYHIRTRDAQRYIQICFHFLRLGNFLLRPNFDSIQALLMTSFVLLNDMKAEASWALLGLTCRLAQSLGLHRTQNLPQNMDARETPEGRKNKEMIRAKLWWTCVWHDTLTSLSFDRSPMTNIPCCPIPLSPTSETEGYQYLETMMKLCQIISERLNPDAATTASYSEILENCQAVEDVRAKVAPQIRNKNECRSAIDRLQYYAIRLHSSFVMSVCCRPALRRGQNNHLDASQKKFLGDKCKESLTETVRMFLAMHQLSVIPTRSWAFTYHGLSSAVLLSILCDTKADPEIRQLQGDLILALSATTQREQSTPTPHIQESDKDIELSGPLSRALAALKNIYEHGHVAGSRIKSENGSMPGSGARTPLQGNHVGGQQQMVGPLLPQDMIYRQGQGQGQNLDPHQNAALAMAEMQQQQQNGMNQQQMQDYSNMQYVPSQPMPQQPGQMPDMSNVDTSTYMSPLDLYDSIFWESPDPFNTGVDSMNFDFLSQPPPGQQPPQQYYF